MANLRLFVAVPLPDPLRGELAAVADRLAGDGRVVPAANLHVTVHFLGGVDAAAAAPLEAALRDAVAPLSPFALVVAGVAPGPRRRPRLLWATFAPDARFRDLARHVHEAAAPVAPEARSPRGPAAPHVTLVRHRGTAPNGVADVSGSVPVAAVELVSSRLGPGGAVYEVLARLPLEATAPVDDREPL
jgi:2'-5' RNA ligase